MEGGFIKEITAPVPNLGEMPAFAAVAAAVAG